MWPCARNKYVSLCTCCRQRCFTECNIEKVRFGNKLFDAFIFLVPSIVCPWEDTLFTFELLGILMKSKRCIQDSIHRLNLQLNIHWPPNYSTRPKSRSSLRRRTLNVQKSGQSKHYLTLSDHQYHHHPTTNVLGQLWTLSHPRFSSRSSCVLQSTLFVTSSSWGLCQFSFCQRVESSWFAGLLVT